MVLTFSILMKHFRCKVNQFVNILQIKNTFFINKMHFNNFIYYNHPDLAEQTNKRTNPFFKMLGIEVNWWRAEEKEMVILLIYYMYLLYIL